MRYLLCSEGVPFTGMEDVSETIGSLSEYYRDVEW